MLERHVNMHFKETETPAANGSAPRRSLDTPPNKLFKRCGKKLRYRRQPWSGMNCVFFDLGPESSGQLFTQQINSPPSNKPCNLPFNLPTYQLINLPTEANADKHKHHRKMDACLNSRYHNSICIYFPSSRKRGHFFWLSELSTLSLGSFSGSSFSKLSFTTLSKTNWIILHIWK